MNASVAMRKGRAPEGLGPVGPGGARHGLRHLPARLAWILATSCWLATGLSATRRQDVRPGDPPRPQQATREVAVPPASGDTAAEIERAHDVQRSFERTRRSHFVRGGWRDEGCDERVGRFCLNHGGDDDWAPSPEAAEVRRAREWLLATLDTVARVAPRDPWILGQRVKYRVEVGRTGDALSLLDGCRGTAGWCEALRGFALHHGGRDTEAEEAFERALRAMDPERRCEWSDLTPLLEPAERRAYRRLACGSPGRRAFETGFWHVSDPMWLVPGRERKVEHLARQVRGELETDAASGYGMPWGDDIAELTLRYGWPAGWDVAWRRVPGVRTERTVHAHRPPDAQRFLASGFGRSGQNGEIRWELEAERPRSSWTPPYGKVHDMPYQIASFRRGDERLIVAAFSAPEDLEDCVVRSGLFLANSFGEVARVEGNGTLPLQVIEKGVAGSASLVGIETRCVGAAGAARARVALPETQPLLSDLLLLEPRAELPGTLDAALPAARRRSTAEPGESIVVFWEWYGPPEPTGTLAITLSLTREGKGFLRKALEWTGLAGRDEEEVGIRWREPGGSDAAARAVELQLPELAPGRYRLTLQVRSARVGAVTSPREIVIVP